MEQWCRVLEASELEPGRGRTVSAGAHRIALFNSDGRFYATDDACPHQGASLAAGALVEGRVICPLHSWVFDLDSGRCPRDSHDPVRTFPTRVVDGAVEVDVADESEPAGSDA